MVPAPTSMALPAAVSPVAIIERAMALSLEGSLEVDDARKTLSEDGE